MMKKLTIDSGQFHFVAQLELERAPKTCARFLQMLPFASQVVHSRWSGEAVWVPMGEFDSKLEFENHTNHPSRGDILFYPGGFSETEILFAYGSSSFASKMGALAGNHFLTVIEGNDQLEEFGKRCLWQGAQDIVFKIIE